jgi:hypothetical protein
MKNEKRNLSPQPPTHTQKNYLKGKKARHLECMLGHSNWMHAISLPKKSSSPFLAWANTPCKEYPTYELLC